MNVVIGSRIPFVSWSLMRGVGLQVQTLLLGTPNICGIQGGGGLALRPARVEGFHGRLKRVGDDGWQQGPGDALAGLKNWVRTCGRTLQARGKRTSYIFTECDPRRP